MNKLLLATALAALCGMAAPALAQTAPTQPATQQAAPATLAAQPTTTAKQRAVPAPGSRNCVRDTGSHIPPPKGQCLPVAGNSYSQKDIQRTGANNVGQALQMLDPSVRVSGGP
jgi:hypothetical protein